MFILKVIILKNCFTNIKIDVIIDQVVIILGLFLQIVNFKLIMIMIDYSNPQIFQFFIIDILFLVYKVK